MSKRPNGDGSIVKYYKKGKFVGWRGAIVVGYKSDGTADRRWVSGKTQKIVGNKLDEIIASVEAGTLTAGENWTISKLLDYHHSRKVDEGVKSNTVESYRDTARLCIAPYIGKLSLEKVKALDISNWQAKLQREGMSASRRAYALRVLKMAFHEAMRLELLTRNVADSIRPPRKPHHEMKCWTEQQAQQFLEQAEQDRLGTAYYLALTTGMRRGEILGLKWADIDWEKSRLTVRNNLVEVRKESEGRIYQGQVAVARHKVELQTPKTAKSRRTISLSPKTIAKLRKHQQAQQREKMNAAEGWQEHDFVFASSVGTHTNPSNFYNRFQELVKQADVPRIRLHDLRHTAASLMILKGVPVKVVSDRLGHSSVAFTLQTYAHLYDEQKESAVFDIDY